jgi:predicted GNAT superfamily acetyltransferase
VDATVRLARSRDDYEACVRLQREVWGLSDLEVTSAIQLVATVHAGGLLLVAEAGAEGVVGFCYAFAALRGGEAHLHSDMLAVRPDWRGRGIGLALKWAQREEALGRGLRLVTWTFDPMRAGNARLNLSRLGATAGELLPDFYGTTSSGLHQGLPTDRLLARWELDSDRVRATAAGEIPPADWESPEPGPVLAIPADWDAVCRGDLAHARSWQAEVSRAFCRLFARGYVAVDCLAPADGLARYVLRRASPGSSPAAAGSPGSEDHSLQEPA